MRTVVSRLWTNWSSSLPDTSARTPRPNWATLPVMARSVKTETFVPVPLGARVAVMVAEALPCPRVSLPSAFSTARWFSASLSEKRTTPLYEAVIGPTLTLTRPRYSSPSTSVNCAPGMQGAIRSRSVSTAHASSMGTATSNSFVNSTWQGPLVCRYRQVRLRRLLPPPVPASGA